MKKQRKLLFHLSSKKSMDRYPFNIFSKYVEGNKHILTGIGVIGTITALFLGLDPLIFDESLQSLQLHFLLFLVVGLLFLTINSALWFTENADSWISGLVVYSLGLIVWRVLEFILDNFRDELNQYLVHITISVIFIVSIYMARFTKKFEEFFEKNVRNTIYKSLLFGVSTFIYLYCSRVILDGYSDFANSAVFSRELFLEPLFMSYIWAFVFGAILIDFLLSKQLMRLEPLWWAGLFVLTLIGVLLIAVQ